MPVWNRFRKLKTEARFPTGASYSNCSAALISEPLPPHTRGGFAGDNDHPLSRRLARGETELFQRTYRGLLRGEARAMLAPPM